MTFRYPIDIAKDLVAVMSGLSKQSMEIHGLGLVSVSPPIFALHFSWLINFQLNVDRRVRQAYGRKS